MKLQPELSNWILYEDDDIVVINKPSGLLSVPGKSEHHKECVMTYLSSTHPTALIVHRLDMDTSGIMIVALHKDAHRALSIQFQDRQVDKTYYALCQGRCSLMQGHVQLPMRCDWDRRPKQIIDFIHGRHAQTHWQVIEQGTSFFSVKLNPITGRSHQLRLHMRSLGHPILGDVLYADKIGSQRTTRLMLHASEIEFTHPRTLQPITIKCAPDFSITGIDSATGDIKR